MSLSDYWADCAEPQCLGKTHTWGGDLLRVIDHSGIGFDESWNLK